MAEYDWHEDFFTRKVLPQLGKDAGECTGFHAWLEVADRQRYDEILRLEQLINELWLAKGDRAVFRKACLDWYKAVMAGIEKWKKAMSMPAPVPVEPKQESLFLSPNMEGISQ
jgi:hypothetical protein